MKEVWKAASKKWLMELRVNEEKREMMGVKVKEYESNK